MLLQTSWPVLRFFKLYQEYGIVHEIHLLLWSGVEGRKE